MALVGVELEMLVNEQDALTTIEFDTFIRSVGTEMKRIR